MILQRIDTDRNIEREIDKVVINVAGNSYVITEIASSIVIRKMCNEKPNSNKINSEITFK